MKNYSKIHFTGRHVFVKSGMFTVRMLLLEEPKLVGV